ncbi:MAG: FkbM family methyltransferase [Planctomycetes bacterium]|nr:FkbM family methyltransferase [Planctomycetota bacterium]
MKTIAKWMALRAGRLEAIRSRIGSVGSLYGILRRQAVFRRTQIDLVIDVGANEGQFAREIRNMYHGEVISFEPVSAAYDKLVKASSHDPLWKAVQLALGEENTTANINVARFGTFSSFLKTSAFCDKHFGPDAAGMTVESVMVRRLDEVLAEVAPNLPQRRPFLKLDTQGFDLRVLKGLGDKLDRFFAIQCEISMIPLYEGMPHWTETISFLERAGFSVVGFTPIVEDRLAVVEFDCLMIRSDQE